MAEQREEETPEFVLEPRRMQDVTSDDVTHCPSARHLRKDMPISGGEAACVVCEVNMARCRANPCKHFCVCISCSRALCETPLGEKPKKARCPSCKEKVDEYRYAFPY